MIDRWAWSIAREHTQIFFKVRPAVLIPIPPGVEAIGVQTVMAFLPEIAHAVPVPIRRRRGVATTG